MMLYVLCLIISVYWKHTCLAHTSFPVKTAKFKNDSQQLKVGRDYDSRWERETQETTWQSAVLEDIRRSQHAQQLLDCFTQPLRVRAIYLVRERREFAHNRGQSTARHCSQTNFCRLSVGESSLYSTAIGTDLNEP